MSLRWALHWELDLRAHLERVQYALKSAGVHHASLKINHNKSLVDWLSLVANIQVRGKRVNLL